MELDAKETISQMGGTGPTSALAYVGTKKVMAGKDHITLIVNGRRGYTTWMITKLEANDTYTVTLTDMRGLNLVEHDRQEQVYADELRHVIETMYDNHMNVKNKGLIPLS